MEVGDDGDDGMFFIVPGDEMAECVCGVGEAEGEAVSIVEHYFEGAVVFDKIASRQQFDVIEREEVWVALLVGH